MAHRFNIKPPEPAQTPMDERDLGEKICEYCDGDGDLEDGSLCPECYGKGTISRDFEDELDDYYSAMEAEWEEREGK